jgi:hypothetical protein
MCDFNLLISNRAGDKPGKYSGKMECLNDAVFKDGTRFGETSK